MSIGSRIKEQRIKLRLNQTDFAKKIDISLDYLRSLETNRRTPSIDLLIKLSEECDCSVDYILGLDQPASWEKITLAGGYEIANELSRTATTDLQRLKAAKLLKDLDRIRDELIQTYGPEAE
ncbi:helix-turn-helix domain-containing protein [Paenibacillus sp. 1P03SA]|uniref:helix-turn-helix domain-containing protein n=1 Tax=Paenibacillus sp. 1P03SA TaxID=3132294 RepID=UPI0039A09EF2